MKTLFKNFGLLAIALVAFTLTGLDASAQLYPPTPYHFYSTGTTNAGTLSWAIIGALSDNGGTPVVTYLDARSDKTSLPKVQFYKVTASTSCNFTNSTVTIPVTQTNGFAGASSDVVIIRHVLTDTYEKRILTTSTGSTNLVTTVAPSTTVPGDIIYDCTTTAAGSIALSTNNVAGIPAAQAMTLTQSGNRVYAGQKGLPLLMEVDGTTTASLNAVTAVIEP